MNNENKTTNPFKEAENEFNPLDNNSDNMQDESSSNNYDNREESNNPYGNNPCSGIGTDTPDEYCYDELFGCS